MPSLLEVIGLLMRFKRWFAVIEVESIGVHRTAVAKPSFAAMSFPYVPPCIAVIGKQRCADETLFLAQQVHVF